MRRKIQQFLSGMPSIVSARVFLQKVPTSKEFAAVVSNDPLRTLAQLTPSTDGGVSCSFVPIGPGIRSFSSRRVSTNGFREDIWPGLLMKP